MDKEKAIVLNNLATSICKNLNVLVSFLFWEVRDWEIHIHHKHKKYHTITHHSLTHTWSNWWCRTLHLLELEFFLHVQ
jgi:hypothetical protein